MGTTNTVRWLMAGLTFAVSAIVLQVGLLCRAAEEDPSRLPKENIALIGYAGAFRGVAATNFDAAMRYFDRNGKLRPLQELAIQRLISDSWSHFFGGTFVLGGHLGSPRPVVAFYNPFFDTAVMTLWATGARRPVLADAWVAENQSRTPKQTEELPSPFEAAERLQQFERIFRQKFPPESAEAVGAIPTEEKRKTGLEVFTAQMIHWQLQLAALQKLDKTLSLPPWRGFLQAVHDGDKSAIQGQLRSNMTATAESILVLPPYIRQSLQPGYTLVASNAVLLFSWSRDFPRFALFSDYRRDEEWHLNNAALLITRP